MGRLEDLKDRAGRGPDERKQFLDALEETYGEQLTAGNAQARRLLAELTKRYGGLPGTPLAKAFFERMMPLLPKADREMFLDEMLHDARRVAHERLEQNWSWWRHLWRRF